MRILGKITKQEEEEIEILNEKVCALKNLIEIMPEANSEMYDRCKNEYDEILDKYQGWWSGIMEKYGWEIMEGESLNINFLTCDLFADE